MLKTISLRPVPCALSRSEIATALQDWQSYFMSNQLWSY